MADLFFSDSHPTGINVIKNDKPYIPGPSDGGPAHPFN